MKYPFPLLSFAVLIPLFNSSCVITSSNKVTDKHSLYLNGKVIDANTRLAISRENKFHFNIDGQNLSKDTLSVKGESNNESVILPNKEFTLKIDSGSSIELVNKSADNIRLEIRVFNHNAKIIQQVYDTKD